jgi:hypothetical protein
MLSTAGAAVSDESGRQASEPPANQWLARRFPSVVRLATPAFRYEMERRRSAARRQLDLGPTTRRAGFGRRRPRGSWRGRYPRTTSRWACGPSPRSRAAMTNDAASRRTSHSNGPGRVSSKSFGPKRMRRSLCLSDGWPPDLALIFATSFLSRKPRWKPIYGLAAGQLAVTVGLASRSASIAASTVG